MADLTWLKPPTEIPLEIRAKQILGFNPNDDQIEAIREIVEWANSGFNNEPFKILGGYAGTGKSSVVKAITAMVSGSVVLCAPTNKAVKVLASLGTTADYCTIYSLLGLKMEQHEDKLKLEKALRDKVGKYNLIVIDECGMINTELLDYIEKTCKMYGVKVLFVGDPGQLNPVGEDLSPVWGKYPMIVLRKVERHDNQILEFATAIRSTKLAELVFKSDNDGNEGVWNMTDREFRKTIMDYATQGKFSEPGTRAIAWRNKTVDSLNHLIRKCIYGDKAHDVDWIVGDRIVFTAPHSIGGEVNDIITDDEAVIEEIAIGQHNEYPNIKCYFLHILLNDSDPMIVKLVHEDSADDYGDELARLATQARNCKDFKKRKEIWNDYWKLNDSVAKVKHGYALTAHRAQGSTYETVFVDSEDILSNNNRKEAKRCLYVAATRPTTRLFST